MTSRSRLLILLVSVPIVVFAVVGGFLGRAMAREDTYQHLRVFEDVVSLISNNYVEEPNVGRVMHGAMHGLTDALDADSTYLTPDQVTLVEKGDPGGPASVGIELTRQYYLRIIAARDGSPAAKAGLRPGDYVRAIDSTPTRDMSVFEGMRALRGAAGSHVSLTIIRGNAAEPHTIDLVRETAGGAAVSGRIAAPGVGYLRVAAFGAGVVDQIRSQAADLQKQGATCLAIDIRRTATGDYDTGLAAARLFVPSGTLAIRESRGGARQNVAATGSAPLSLPVVLLTDPGTSGAAELFASALVGNKRADLVGERTLGRAARQTLVKLPDGSGVWLSTERFLTPAGTPLHEKGLEPTVVVDEPDVEFGQPIPSADPALDKAIERLTTKAVA